jgi:hypothetical protein
MIKSVQSSVPLEVKMLHLWSASIMHHGSRHNLRVRIPLSSVLMSWGYPETHKESPNFCTIISLKVNVERP